MCECFAWFVCCVREQRAKDDVAEMRETVMHAQTKETQSREELRQLQLTAKQLQDTLKVLPPFPLCRVPTVSLTALQFLRPFLYLIKIWISFQIWIVNFEVTSGRAKKRSWRQLQTLGLKPRT